MRACARTPTWTVLQKMEKSAEILLVEQACVYLNSGEYPPTASDNQKRSIRRKAKKLCVKSGEIFYVHKNGLEVRLAMVM